MTSASPHTPHQGKPHILIGGTGRAGTTLLVQIFTHLGFDTGYTPVQSLSDVDPISKAGLERFLTERDLPHVVKSPHFADQIDEALSGGLHVEAAIVPMRRLFDAAESRRHVYRQAMAAGLNAADHPGSVWKVTNLEDQERVLVMQFYRFLHPLVAHDVPIVLLDFPRFVDDGSYLYARLASIFDRHAVSRDAVLDVHRRLARPALVNPFIEPSR